MATMVAFGIAILADVDSGSAQAAGPPVPLMENGKPVDWWFVFKFNASSKSGLDGCGKDSGTRTCPFGGRVITDKRGRPFSQRYTAASSAGGKLQQGKVCLGMTTDDPVGATFDQVYNGKVFFVIWNDQFYGDPPICRGAHGCPSPWGHSKGMLAWDDSGQGFVMQVTTPSWPGAGRADKPRKKSAGNTLGCVGTNNNLKFSQHFFAAKLNKSDLAKVLKSLALAGVVTDPANPQIVRNGGPDDIRELVDNLGQRPKKLRPEDLAKKALAELATIETLDTAGVTLIAKSSHLHVPPWQLASAMLDGQANRSGTWWANPRIPSTNKRTAAGVSCWSAKLPEKAGPSAVALTGHWKDADTGQDRKFGMIGGSNHAKIGVTTSGGRNFTIFGDLNQQGRLKPPKCDSSQNGRGGLFFAVEGNTAQGKALFESVSDLLEGDTAPVGR